MSSSMQIYNRTAWIEQNTLHRNTKWSIFDGYIFCARAGDAGYRIELNFAPLCLNFICSELFSIRTNVMRLQQMLTRTIMMTENQITLDLFEIWKHWEIVLRHPDKKYVKSSCHKPLKTISRELQQRAEIHARSRNRIWRKEWTNIDRIECTKHTHMYIMCASVAHMAEILLPPARDRKNRESEKRKFWVLRKMFGMLDCCSLCSLRRIWCILCSIRCWLAEANITFFVPIRRKWTKNELKTMTEEAKIVWIFSSLAIATRTACGYIA